MAKYTHIDKDTAREVLNMQYMELPQLRQSGLSQQLHVRGMHRFGFSLLTVNDPGPPLTGYILRRVLSPHLGVPAEMIKLYWENRGDVDDDLWKLDYSRQISLNEERILVWQIKKKYK